MAMAETVGIHDITQLHPLFEELTINEKCEAISGDHAAKTYWNRFRTDVPTERVPFECAKELFDLKTSGYEDTAKMDRIFRKYFRTYNAFETASARNVGVLLSRYNELIRKEAQFAEADRIYKDKKGEYETARDSKFTKKAKTAKLETEMKGLKVRRDEWEKVLETNRKYIKLLAKVVSDLVTFSDSPEAQEAIEKSCEKKSTMPYWTTGKEDYLEEFKKDVNLLHYYLGTPSRIPSPAFEPHVQHMIKRYREEEVNVLNEKKKKLAKLLDAGWKPLKKAIALWSEFEDEVVKVLVNNDGFQKFRDEHGLYPSATDLARDEYRNIMNMDDFYGVLRPKSHHYRRETHDHDIASASGGYSYPGDYSRALVSYDEGYDPYRSLISGESEVLLAIMFVIGIVVCGIWWLCCAVAGYLFVSTNKAKKKKTKKAYDDIESQSMSN